MVVAHAYGLDMEITAEAVTWSTAIVVVAALALPALLTSEIGPLRQGMVELPQLFLLTHSRQTRSPSFFTNAPAWIMVKIKSGVVTEV